MEPTEKLHVVKWDMAHEGKIFLLENKRIRAISSMIAFV